MKKLFYIVTIIASMAMFTACTADEIPTKDDTTTSDVSVITNKEGDTEPPKDGTTITDRDDDIDPPKGVTNPPPPPPTPPTTTIP